LSLQAYDPAAGSGIGVVAGIGPLPDGRLGARFLLLLGDQCLTMFTGEESSPRRSAVGGLELRPTERGLALRFTGPALWIPDGARHFRFEAAQSAARVVEVAARLELTTEPGSSYGPVHGEVAIDGRATAIRTAGFADAAIGRPARVPGTAALRLLAGFGGGAGFTVQMQDGAPGSIVRLGPGHPDTVPPQGPLEVAPWPGGALDGAPSGLVLEPCDAPPLVCRPRSRVALLRPLDGARYARVSFGVAEFEWGDLGTGSGFFEHLEVQPAPVSDGEAADPGPAAG
jgi:hypothetical protein